jgi:hypothetical protein
LLLPTVAASVGYDDNVFAANRNRQDDFVFRIEPEVRLVSQWSRHHLELAAGGRGDFYQDFTSENHGQVYAAGNTVVDVRHDLKVLSHFNYTFGHEARGTGESFRRFDDLIEYQSSDGGVFVNKTFNRLWVQLGGALRQADYEDTSLAGTVIDQDFRDGTISEAIGTVGYEVSPRTSLFAELAHNWRDYRGAAFDSEGYRVLAGVSYELTRLMRGEIAAGYLSQHFESSVRDDISTYTYRGQLVWEPTPLIRMILVGRRDVGPPSHFPGTSSRIDSEAGVRIDYAVRRNLTLSGLAAYSWVDLVGLGRKDSGLKFQASAQYTFDPTWSLWLEHTHTEFDGDAVPERDRANDLLMANVKARF